MLSYIKKYISFKSPCILSYEKVKTIYIYKGNNFLQIMLKEVM